LDEVVNLTEAMYVAAMAAEWDELDVLQQQQAALIKQTVSENLATNTEVLQRVTELTHLVIDIAEAHRLELYDDLMQLKKNGSAQNAYLQNSE
jgi:hypothetical protein